MRTVRLCYCPPMRVVGVDENGLGPRLGPLVATAATLEVRRYDAPTLQWFGAQLGLGDSKKTSGFGKMAAAEGFALAVAERELGRVPKDVDALLEALSLDGLLGLRAPCPDRASRDQCWSAPASLPAFGGDVEQGHNQLEALASAGVRITRVRTTLSCAGVLNAAVDEGRSKLRVDLSMFERLVIDARHATKRNLVAYCGMVGGIRAYEDYFERFTDVTRQADDDHEVFQVARVGQVRFEKKADDRHLPVGIASMIGKVVRELTMGRIVRYYQDRDDSLGGASGYHDPVTGRFVASTRDARRRLKVATDCFERRG